MDFDFAARALAGHLVAAPLLALLIERTRPRGPISRGMSYAMAGSLVVGVLSALVGLFLLVNDSSVDEARFAPLLYLATLGVAALVVIAALRLVLPSGKGGK